MQKGQRPTRSMRYLLSVDRSLRRVSLKKISVRVKNAKNRVRSRAAKRADARETTGSWSAWVSNAWPSVRAAAPALIAIVAGAMLIGAPGLLRSDSSVESATSAPSASRETPPSALPLDTTVQRVDVLLGETGRVGQMHRLGRALAVRLDGHVDSILL